MSPLWFFMLILASFRLTRLLVEDSITEGVRSRIAHLPVIGDLISCHWCAGFWVSLALVAGNHVWPDLMYWPIVVLAVAGGGGLIASFAARA